MAAFSLPATPSVTMPASSANASIRLSRIETLSSTTNAFRANSGLLVPRKWLSVVMARL